MENLKTNTTIQHLTLKLRESFDGDPWYGDSTMKKLKAMDYKIVDKKPLVSFHSIAEILQHMINWRIYLIKKMQGDVSLVIRQNDENDWTHVSIKTENEWNELIKRLQSTQNEIVSFLSSSDDDFLDNNVAGKNYNFGYLLEGIIQHDIYHLGQMALVKKWIETTVD